LSVYADTSFLVSLYVPDANSGRAAAYMNDASLPILLTPLGEVELTNALSLRLFRKELTPSKIKASRALLAIDVADGVFRLTPLPPAAYARAALIARRRTPQLGTRTLDVLHVASALTLNVNTFCTFDRNQEKLAKREGMIVVPAYSE
jgi:predicted nucleic acid-binding protein